MTAKIASWLLIAMLVALASCGNQSVKNENAAEDTLVFSETEIITEDTTDNSPDESETLPDSETAASESESQTESESETEKESQSETQKNDKGGTGSSASPKEETPKATYPYYITFNSSISHTKRNIYLHTNRYLTN